MSSCNTRPKDVSPMITLGESRKMQAERVSFGREGCHPKYFLKKNPSPNISSKILVLGISGWDKLTIFTHYPPIVDLVKNTVGQNLSLQDVESEHIEGVNVVGVISFTFP